MAVSGKNADMERTSLGSSAILLAAAAVAFWLLSYSWLLGYLIPMEGAGDLPVSPWLVAELAAIPLGCCAVVVAVAALGQTGTRRTGVRAAAWAGGLAALLALLSVAA